MNKWKLEKVAGNQAVVNTTTKEVVLYVDYLDIKVVEDIIEVYNAGQGEHEIDEMLLNTDKCTQDEREFIMEQISNYLKLANMNTTETFPEVLETVQPDKIIGTENAPVTEPKQRKRRISAEGAISKVSPADYLKSLQEKMDIVRLLDAVEMPEIPSNLTKANRDIMVDFQKEHNALIGKYMGLIQKA